MKIYEIQIKIETTVHFTASSKEEAERMARGKVSGYFKSLKDFFYNCEVTTHGVKEL